MPESELAEKLGFRVEGRDRIIILHDREVREIGIVTQGESALWNLCLELSERLAGFEMEIRKHLWMGHGHTGMYGDDGEMQCSQCPKYWDYKREPLENLREQVAVLNNQRMNEAMAQLADLERKDA